MHRNQSGASILVPSAVQQCPCSEKTTFSNVHVPDSIPFFPMKPCASQFPGSLIKIATLPPVPLTCRTKKFPSCSPFFVFFLRFHISRNYWQTFPSRRLIMPPKQILHRTQKISRFFLFIINRKHPGISNFFYGGYEIRTTLHYRSIILSLFISLFLSAISCGRRLWYACFRRNLVCTTKFPFSGNAVNFHGTTRFVH